MSNLNRVTMIGNVGTEPEQREFESGAKVTKFSIGVSRWNKKDQKDVTDWFDVETFSKLGDYIKKGLKVCVDGSMITSVFDGKDGNKVKRYYILANTVEILTKKDDVDSGNGNGNTEQSNTQEATEDLGCNADYPEDENTELEPQESGLPHSPSIDEIEIDEDEIPF